MKKEEEWVEEAPPLVGSGLSGGDDGTRAREVCSHAWTHCEVPPPLPLVTVARPGKLSSQVQSCRVVNTDFSVHFGGVQRKSDQTSVARFFPFVFIVPISRVWSPHRMYIHLVYLFSLR